MTPKLTWLSVLLCCTAFYPVLASDSADGEVQYMSLPGSVRGRGSLYLTGLPDRIDLPFYRGRNGSGIYLDGTVNGQQMRFHFDTGSFGTVVGRNFLQSAAAGKKPAGESFEIHGVGAGGQNQAARQMMELRIGPVCRRDFPVFVQDNLQGPPILGQDFLKDFDFSIDNAGKIVSLYKNTGKGNYFASKPGSIDIPYISAPGGLMLVEALVNGRKCKMCFDTGADSICFSPAQFRSLGIASGSGGEVSTSYGVGGASTNRLVPIGSLKVGSLQKTGLRASLLESASMSWPLLGQEFYSNYDISVSRSSKLIRLSPPGHY